VAVEPAERLRELQGKLGDAVTLLADPEGKVCEAYGVLDPAPVPRRRMARSATFLLDRAGLVLACFFPDSYRTAPRPPDVLARLRARGE